MLGLSPWATAAQLGRKFLLVFNVVPPGHLKVKPQWRFLFAAENVKIKMISSKILLFVQKILHSLNTFPRQEAFCVWEGWRPILEKKMSRNYWAVPLSVKKESRENSLFVQTMNPMFFRKTCQKAFFIKIMYIQSFKKHWSEKGKMFAWSGALGRCPKLRPPWGVGSHMALPPPRGRSAPLRRGVQGLGTSLRGGLH